MSFGIVFWAVEKPLYEHQKPRKQTKQSEYSIVGHPVETIIETERILQSSYNECKGIILISTTCVTGSWLIKKGTI